MTPQWYVLRIRPRSETRAAAGLQREGFDVFLPHVRMASREVTHAYEPLFPGYIFLRCDMNMQGAEKVYRQPGVLGWVRFGDVIPTVPDNIIAELSDNVDRTNKGGGAWRCFLPGETVRVVSGALDSLGQVVRGARSPRDSVRLLLEFMGRNVTAQVPWHDLEPVPLASHVAAAHKSRRTRGRGRWIRGLGPSPMLAPVAGGYQNNRRPTS